ncbi:MAG: hypothetical protein JXR95_08040 [Deltaproteobacteria bacterium]|nr:hypothetical protein [Deltaproteobacteria bacterium]
MNPAYWLIITYLVMPVPLLLLSLKGVNTGTVLAAGIFTLMTLFSTFLAFKKKKHGVTAAPALFFMIYILVTIFYIRIY